METLEEYLKSHAANGLLEWPLQKEASKLFGLSLRDVEEAALQLEILPARYERNRKTISLENQLLLLRSGIAVVGCGGLGGFIIEELARLGVGRIVAIDPDVFSESNLNRQILSTIDALGMPKADVACRRVGEINPAVTCIAAKVALTGENGPGLLKGVQVVLDGLDSIPVRLMLSEVCHKIGVPLVHGAIGGWYGQVTTQFPGDRTLETLYGSYSGPQGVEKILGNPSFTPAIIASMQAAEACKILLSEGIPLRSRMISVNLREMEFLEVNL